MKISRSTRSLFALLMGASMLKNLDASPLCPSIISDPSDSLGKSILGESVEQTDSAFHLFDELRTINDEVKNYFDLALTHLDGFRVMIYPPNTASQSKELANGELAYLPGKKTIVVPYNTHFNDRNITFFDLAKLIRHEMFHASQHAVQLTLSGKNTISLESFFPPADEELSNITMSMFQAGDREVEKLKKLLELERHNQLNVKQKKILRTLREDSENEYHAYYRLYNLEELTDKQMKESGIRAGEMINLSPNCLFTIETIEAVADGKWIITGYYNDPLHAAIYSIPEAQKKVLSLYQKRQYFYEREAYLHGSIPQNLIRHLFSELYEQRINLINRARSMHPFPNPSPLNNYVDYEILKSHNKLAILTMSDALIAETAEDYFFSAQTAVKMNKMNEAKIGFNNLIQHGYYVPISKLILARINVSEGDLKKARDIFTQLTQDEFPADIKAYAHLELALIENKANNHRLAVVYFERAAIAAKKANVKFSIKDEAAYNFSLEKIGQKQDPDKREKIANHLVEHDVLQISGNVRMRKG